MNINLQELESLAISPDYPMLGDIATLQQMGDKVLVTQYLFDDAVADEIERLIEARYPHVRVEVTQQRRDSKTSSEKFNQLFGQIAVEFPSDN